MTRRIAYPSCRSGGPNVINVNLLEDALSFKKTLELMRDFYTNEEHWIQKEISADNGDRRCLGHELLCAMVGILHGDRIRSFDISKAIGIIYVTKLASFLPEEFRKLEPVTALARFNDHRETTIQHIRSLIDRALEAEKKNEQTADSSEATQG